MRARTVNEAQEFERGKSPKAVMGIGGIDLFKDIQNRLDELDYEIGTTKFTAGEKYEEDLRDMFVGKTITAHMSKLPSLDIKTKETKSHYENGEFTVNVVDIKPTSEFSELYDQYKQVGFIPSLILAGDDGSVYNLKIKEGQKIHFDES